MVDVTLLSVFLAFLVGVAAALIGGAVGGMLVARQGGIETELGAWMGSFYGPLGAVPGILIGLIVLAIAGG